MEHKPGRMTWVRWLEESGMGRSRETHSCGVKEWQNGPRPAQWQNFNPCLRPFRRLFQSRRVRHIPDFVSHRAKAVRPACTRLEAEASLNQSEPASVGPNKCSVSRLALSNSKGKAGSIGRGSAACWSWCSISCGCFISSMEIGEPQCAQIESVARLIDAPQLEQLTV